MVIVDVDTYNLRVKFRSSFMTIDFLASKTIKDVVELDANRILALTLKPPHYFIVDLEYN